MLRCQKETYLKRKKNTVSVNRVFIRKVKVKDAPILVHWLNNKKNTRYMSPLVRCHRHTKISVKKEIKNVDRFYERLFMVYVKGQDKPIGHAGIDDIYFEDKRGEIFFLIGDKENQGKGYGKEIVNALLRYGFKRLHLHSISATAVADNQASIHLLQKAGFKKIGIRREYNCINGRFVDEIQYDLLAKEYNQKVKAL